MGANHGSTYPWARVCGCPGVDEAAEGPVAAAVCPVQAHVGVRVRDDSGGGNLQQQKISTIEVSEIK